MLDLVSTWMGGRLQTCRLYTSQYVTSHPGQLSLAITLWGGTASTTETWGVNRHTECCTSFVSMVTSQCKLVSGWVLRKWRSVPLYGSYVGTIENHGDTEIMETVIFTKCRVFAKMPCFAVFLAKMLFFFAFSTRTFGF